METHLPPDMDIHSVLKILAIIGREERGKEFREVGVSNLPLGS